MSSTARKQAPRLAKPAVRYWRGKVPKGLAEAYSDSDAEEEPSNFEEGDIPINDHDDDEEEDEGFGTLPKRQMVKPKAMNLALKDVSVSKEGRVVVAGREESGRTALEEEDEDSDEQSEDRPIQGQGETEESSEYESDSDEEPQVEFRPVFIPKRARATIAERENIAQDTEEALRRKEGEAEERRKQSHDLVAASIRRELAEKEKEEEIPDVDDTDGLDPAAEFEAWRLRELGRIKMEREAELQREKERQEIERRRAMPAEQRMKEDLERAQKLRDEKPKGQQKFLQKYWHKGAFHQDEEILQRHDYTEATESTVDVSLLPKVMQVKNFGKRSRTKYTHLLDQDTTVQTKGFGTSTPVKGVGTFLEGGCFLCGGPHLKKGLTAAHLLERPLEGTFEDVEFEVHVFEKAPSIGMDCSSISLTAPGLREDWRIDVPMRSFQGGYYSHLISFYESLGIMFRPADFTYSFSSLFLSPKLRRITTTMIYNGASGRAGVSKPSSLGGNSKNLGVFASTIQNVWATGLFICMTTQLLLCFIITLFHAVPIWRSTSAPSIVFRDWAVQTKPHGFLAKLCGMDVAWQDYIHSVLLPLLSAVCTAPEEDVMNHPMEEFLDYIWLTLGTHHYVVVSGVRDVVTRLTANLQHLYLSSPILAIRSAPHDPRFATIQYFHDGQTQEVTGFRHIILATQASGAIPLLTSYLQSLPSNQPDHIKAIEDQIQCLKSFQYRRSTVVNHTDSSLLPDDGRDIRDLNLITLNRNSNHENLLESTDKLRLCVSSSYTMTTHILPRPQGYPEDKPQVYQTTNPIIEPKKDCLLSVATLERAIVTMKSKKALALLSVAETRTWWQCPYQATTRLGVLQGARKPSDGDGPGIWLCGSYAHSGIPLLEGCVVSARNVVEQGILESEGVQW
ncbi:hypothetical protein BYT27DRAFT_7223445 [Phlegmacium glaucopus]|nr:hypothetical protein BYT27DRAFT_7223445 [Phlegmacium glaucopus]